MKSKVLAKKLAREIQQLVHELQADPKYGLVEANYVATRVLETVEPVLYSVEEQKDER